jgi:GNAT superfamily N-acetyltransferase
MASDLSVRLPVFQAWHTVLDMALPAGVVVRRGRPGDSPHVWVLLHQLGYTPSERSYDETFTQVVRHPEAAVFVAAEGTKILGYLAISQRPQIRLGGRVAVIDELVVDEKRRGCGIGAALLETAVRYATGLGCRRLELAAGRSRESYLRGFFGRHGFVEIDSALLRIEPLANQRIRPSRN